MKASFESSRIRWYSPGMWRLVDLGRDRIKRSVSNFAFSGSTTEHV